MTGESGYQPTEEFPVEILGDKAVIGTPVEFDLENNQVFKDKLLELASNEELRTLTIDMARCEFIPSTFFNTLIAAVKRARGNDTQFTMRGMADRRIRKPFEIMGFNHVFTYEDETIIDDTAAAKAWAEEHNARPVVDDYGNLRVLFPGQEAYGHESDVSWDTLAEHFDAKHIAFQHQLQAQAGKDYPYAEFITVPEPKK